MASIFSKIINREIPGHFIYEDDQCAVILDKYPAVPGQCLVILKREVDYIFDLTEAEYQHLFATVKKVAHALDTTFNTERTCVVVEGFEVPHVHIKLYPMANKNENLGDVITRVEEATDAVLTALTEKIKQHL
ncbi:HIT family protein [bacterium]|nr:HIT family protein [bacterium]|tara:strand:+ start:523 stop:921 length:399 start_codon:yes stop_codon:yes gene_type:complete